MYIYAGMDTLITYPHAHDASSCGNFNWELNSNNGYGQESWCSSSKRDLFVFEILLQRIVFRFSLQTFTTFMSKLDFAMFYKNSMPHHIADPKPFTVIWNSWYFLIGVMIGFRSMQHHYCQLELAAQLDADLQHVFVIGLYCLWFCSCTKLSICSIAAASEVLAKKST